MSEQSNENIRLSEVVSADLETYEVVEASAILIAGGYEHMLHRWRDPFTPPRTKLDCIKYRRIFGRRICVEWAPRCQWLYNEAFLIVSIPSAPDVRTIVLECLREPAVIVAISGWIAACVAGTPACPVATVTLQAAILECLNRRFADAEVLGIDIRSSWGNWGGC